MTASTDDAAQAPPDDADPIVPSVIHHRVDEVRIDGVVDERWNYLEYEFERGGVLLRARAYRTGTVGSACGPATTQS